MADRIICPNVNCGYKGDADPRPRGNTLVLLVLLFFFLLPGIFYWVFRAGHDNYCPRCNLLIGRAVDGSESRSDDSGGGAGALLPWAILLAVGVIAAGIYLDTR